ncbi:MAG: Co2+/Mg2+ efflux protein ApaG [Rhodothermales bacterium]|nr:Co2+/Mg2+ efflux protein ApaG [Rhodothermales bacterium]
MLEYEALTDTIRVIVRPIYLDGQTDIMSGRFVFGYFIRIENEGSQEVQLLRRHWFINDGTGKVQEVEGEGVVGNQPVIESGGFHEYNSYCVLETFEGSMEGSYLMQRPSGERFRVVIPRFNLRAAAN